MSIAGRFTIQRQNVCVNWWHQTCSSNQKLERELQNPKVEALEGMKSRVFERKESKVREKRFLDTNYVEKPHLCWNGVDREVASICSCICRPMFDGSVITHSCNCLTVVWTCYRTHPAPVCLYRTEAFVVRQVPLFQLEGEKDFYFKWPQSDEETV